MTHLQPFMWAGCPCTGLREKRTKSWQAAAPFLGRSSWAPCIHHLTHPGDSTAYPTSAVALSHSRCSDFSHRGNGPSCQQRGIPILTNSRACALTLTRLPPCQPAQRRTQMSHSTSPAPPRHRVPTASGRPLAQEAHKHDLKSRSSAFPLWMPPSRSGE